MKGLSLLQPVTPQSAALDGITSCSVALFKAILDISVETGLPEDRDKLSQVTFLRGHRRLDSLLYDTVRSKSNGPSF